MNTEGHSVAMDQFTETYTIDRPYDLVSTLSLLSMGLGDPTFRIDSKTSVRFVALQGEKPITFRFAQNESSISVDVHGTDIEWLRPLIPDLLGLEFVPPTIDGPHRLKMLAKQLSGMRIYRLPIIFPRIVQVILQQLVSYQDACRGWRYLVQRYGIPIEGEDDLMAPPSHKKLARMASHEFVECGVLPQHGRRIVGVARSGRRIEEIWNGGIAEDATDNICSILETFRGIGPWTIGFLRGTAFGDADAIVPQDYGFPKQVCHFFNGQETGTDEEMIELLEPYRPHRFYVLSLLIKGGTRVPRRGPRRASIRTQMRRS